MHSAARNTPLNRNGRASPELVNHIREDFLVLLVGSQGVDQSLCALLTILNLLNQHGAAVWCAPCGHPSTHPYWGECSSSFSFVILSGTPHPDGGFRQSDHQEASTPNRQDSSRPLATAVRDRVSGPCHSGLRIVGSCCTCRFMPSSTSFDGAGCQCLSPGCAWRLEPHSASVPVPVSPTS